MNANAISKFRTAKQTVVNDTTRRFGYTGGVPMLAMDAAKSGLDCNPITGGRLLLFVHNPKASGYIGPGVDMFTGARKKQYVALYPTDYQSVVDRAFHTSNDMSYRNLDMLTKVPYEVSDTYYHDTADDYFAVVHPNLWSVNENGAYSTQCPYGLNQPVQMTDPQAGASTPIFQFCPTCQLADLKSDVCSQRIYAASESLDSAILADLRAVCIEACEAALLHADNAIQVVMSEIAGRMTGQHGRTTMLVVDRIHLKMQHKDEMKPEQAGTIELMKALGKEIAGAVAPAAPAPIEGKVLSPEEAREYEIYQNRKAALAKARDAKGKTEEE